MENAGNYKLFLSYLGMEGISCKHIFSGTYS